jgi:hypothetical protein
MRQQNANHGSDQKNTIQHYSLFPNTQFSPRTANGRSDVVDNPRIELCLQCGGR